jgi:hypothetical protein
MYALFLWLTFSVWELCANEAGRCVDNWRDILLFVIVVLSLLLALAVASIVTSLRCRAVIPVQHHLLATVHTEAIDMHQAAVLGHGHGHHGGPGASPYANPGASPYANPYVRGGGDHMYGGSRAAQYGVPHSAVQPPRVVWSTVPDSHDGPAP